MKSITKYFIPCTLMVFISCNSGDQKVETKNTTQESTTTDPSGDTLKKEEPKKTNISVGPDGASIETKKGTQVKVDSGGVKVGTKDVNITVNPEKKKKGQ
jgi:hypothetical protein